MKANSSPMSVADYCHQCNAKSIIVNEEYQRKEGLWSSPARSYFIESILLEYPIPKLYLYANVDLKTKQTIKEIVDGQQRTQALVAFYNNKLRLSTNLETEELKNLRYSQLPDEWKTRFLSYSLPIDQFSGVPEDEVREAFRRMNANNVPLNAEEQRNARFQGPLKWFIISIAKEFKDILFRLGLFSRRDLIRMADLKLYGEMLLTLDSGFHTVKASQLDGLYRKYNASLDLEDKFREQIFYGVNVLLDHDVLHKPSFMRAHVFQSIALAAIARRFGGSFDDEARAKHGKLAELLDKNPIDLEILGDAIRDPDAYSELQDFTVASTRATNVEAARIVRFLYFRAALAEVV